MATVSIISGVHTPNEGRALINTNFTNVNTDLVIIKTITDSLTGNVVGVDNVQTFTNKTIKSNNAMGGTNNTVEVTRKDIKTDLFQLKAYNNDALAGTISNIEVDAGSIYDLVVSGGNGIKTHVDGQHLKIVGETDFLLNNASQKFGMGVDSATLTTYAGYGYTTVLGASTANLSSLAVGAAHTAQPNATLHVKHSSTGNMLRLQNTNPGSGFDGARLTYQNSSQE
jgi:hypothetical protein